MFAVQFAHQNGAKVIATCSADNVEFVKSLGADEVLDYKAVRFEEDVSGVDVVLDTQGGDTQERSWETLKSGGILVSVVSPPSEDKAAEANAKGVMVQIAANKALLTEIAEMLDAGTIKTEIAKTFPLSEARQAQDLSQIGHTRGKIVLQIA
ncbi:MAG: zinc-binding dehydrogenase [Chthonomonadaceae bacterium]|nr:zinc-binding dehydrogenase [Chthonomonadaceae bacterium]